MDVYVGNSCQYPFDGDSDLEVIKKVQRGIFEFPDHVVVSEDAQDFVRKLICLGLLFLLPPPPVLPFPLSLPPPLLSIERRGMPIERRGMLALDGGREAR